MRRKLSGIINVAFDTTGGLLIIYSTFTYKETVHQLFIDFKNAYDSVGRGVLDKILIEFGIPRKLVSLIKMSLTKT